MNSPSALLCVHFSFNVIIRICAENHHIYVGHQRNCAEHQRKYAELTSAQLRSFPRRVDGSVDLSGRLILSYTSLTIVLWPHWNTGIFHLIIVRHIVYIEKKELEKSHDELKRGMAKLNQLKKELEPYEKAINVTVPASKSHYSLFGYFWFNEWSKPI